MSQKTNTKNLYIKTYGCQMNIYDSEKMIDLLQPHGFQIINTPDKADLVILNTCNIREKASDKVHSELGRITQLKNNNHEMIVVVAGCVGQAEGENIIKRSSCVNIVVGPQSYHNLPELIEQVKRDKSWIVDLDFYEHEKFDNLPITSHKHSPTAFLSVQEGCDKFCHFCVVPYTRGAEFSRSVVEIYREAMSLALNGCKEITLLGQNVSAYHGQNDVDGEATLGGLIKLLHTIDGIKRIRYTTSHPNDMLSSDLLLSHTELEKLMPYIHLPVQSGSDAILKAMNRKHNVEFYLELIAKFKSVRADIAFSSDFIVGYPGETDQDFNDTLALVEYVQYSQAYSFKYSQRPGTPASMLNNQISEEVKNERLQKLQNLLAQQQTAFNQQKVGMTMQILLEKPGKYEGQLIGKSPYMQSTVIQNPNYQIGDMPSVIITKATQNSLYGEVINS